MKMNRRGKAPQETCRAAAGHYTERYCKGNLAAYHNTVVAHQSTPVAPQLNQNYPKNHLHHKTAYVGRKIAAQVVRYYFLE